ncbi:MAG: RNA polymerase sigma factor RpoD/SigA [Candidatus Acetothermia bacterium]
MSNSTMQNYFNTLSNAENDVLSREEEQELARRIAKGDQEAREELAQHNLRLVVSIAKNYRNYGVDFEDLVQEGNAGLMKAVDRFDPEKGYKFSTYATWWIRQAILKSLNNTGRTVRIPAHMSSLLRDIKNFEESFLRDRGREPTLEEVAEGIEVPEDKIRLARMSNEGTSSLDKPLGEGQETNIMSDLIEDERLSSPEEEVEEDLFTEKLKCLLNQELTDREKQIIRLRYGLAGKEKTLEETGEVFGISRERVRQIQERALDKLRETDLERFKLGILSKN